MNRNQIGQSLPSTGCNTGENKIRESGKIEIALVNLSGRVDHLEKLSEGIINLIMNPQPMPCSTEGVPCNSDPTLSQQINRIDYRIDDVTQKLALAIDVISQNLGGIKLD